MKLNLIWGFNEASNLCYEKNRRKKNKKNQHNESMEPIPFWVEAGIIMTKNLYCQGARNPWWQEEIDV
jgi:hypothetical protein